MSKIVIETDLTTEGTKISVDGVVVTDVENVVSVSLYGRSALKNPGEYDSKKGYISVDYSSINSEGVVERKSFETNEWTGDRKALGKIEDSVTDEQVVRYIGKNVDSDIKKMADKIVQYYADNDLKGPNTTELYDRSAESLKDKIVDLGIDFNDAEE